MKTPRKCHTTAKGKSKKRERREKKKRETDRKVEKTSDKKKENQSYAELGASCL